MFDMVIINGKVVDGTGSEPEKLDVGIIDGKIADIGILADAESVIKVNADGNYVCPGFIDAHSHSDTYLLIEPSAQSKIYQGITTEVVGNCGASCAPIVNENCVPSDWSDKEYPGHWHSVAEYRELLEQVRPAPNVVLLIGHNTLRRGVAGYENRPLTASELRKMVRLLEAGLEEGGKGLSSGLIYAPGMYAPCEELAVLAATAGKHGGVYASHMRNEGSHLLEALNEIISIAEKAQVKAQISHLKTSGRNSWNLIDEALEFIRDARARGISVAADRYPYTSGCTELDVIFPAWAQEGGKEKILERLKDASERKRLKEDVAQGRDADDWNSVMVGSTHHPDNERFRGMSLVEVAEILETDPVEAALHLIETDELKTSAFFFGMSEDNMRRILAEPYVMIGTDASLRSVSGPLSHDYPHPRAYGSFPRFLRMVLDEGLVSLPEAVRKMTSLPADQFGLKQRGIIRKRAWADIVIFDSGKVRDTATYADPHKLAEGINYVIVNGEITLACGRLTGNCAGRMLT